MGERKIVDKSVGPAEIARALQAGSITTAQAQQMFNGVMPIGDYKGAAAILDLDLLVKQPLVLAEQLHILGVLDGREEDYDLQTLQIAVGAAINTAVTGEITVPSDEVWYINAIEGVIPASGGANIITYNWHCSLWADRAVTPSPYGQPFHAAAVDLGVGGGTQWDEFTSPANWWAATNKPILLRLPAGATLTAVFTNTNAVAAATVSCIFRIYGFIGKALVD